MTCRERKYSLGRENDVLLDYFDDNERFADLCNATLFNGLQVIDPAKLEDASERYTQRGRDSRGKITYSSRYRDVKKRLKDGGTIRIMAVEAQGRVDYSMPLRCMNYDVQEYLKQLKRLQAANDRENVYTTAAERFSRLRKSDRLAPVYTICLYHGMEEWDGPLSLGDMMNFGEGPEAYRSLDRETMEVIMVMTRNTRLMEDVRAFWEEEKGCDMCEALKGIQEDGIAIGMEKGILALILSLRECRIPDSVILQKLEEKFALTRQKAEEYLKMDDDMAKISYEKQ